MCVNFVKSFWLCSAYVLGSISGVESFITIDEQLQ